MFNCTEDKEMKKRIEIVGIPIDNLVYEEVLKKMDQLIPDKRKVYIVTANPEMILNASQDKMFFNVLKGAEIATPDGVGILWAAHYLSKPLPKKFFFQYLQLFGSLFSILVYPKKVRSVLRERITGADLFPKIIDYSQKKAWRIFLLGASKGVAEGAINHFSKAYPKANFVGCYAGTPKSMDEKEICDRINEVKPDIIFVAYGSPQQELWIHRNLFKLDSVKIAIGIGGSFDFYAGKIKRAPHYVRKVGLEWLWRLVQEPKRVVRIWNATVGFVTLVAKEKMKK